MTDETLPEPQLQRQEPKPAQDKGIPWAYVLAAGLVIFIVAYALLRSSGPKAYTLEGMRIESDIDPRTALAIIMSKQPQIVRMEMYNASDRRNSIVISIAAEAIRTIAVSNRTVGSYGLIFDPNDSSKAPTELGCDENNSQCAPPTITVRYGPCNCLKLDSVKRVLTVEGDDQFLGDDVVKLGGIIGLAYNDIGPLLKELQPTATPAFEPSPNATAESNATPSSAQNDETNRTENATLGQGHPIILVRGQNETAVPDGNGTNASG